jgi:Cu-processing system ATP-binding protein
MELIRMVQDIRGAKGEAGALIERFDLQPYLNKKLGHLSGGTKQKVNLVLAFMYDVPMYILDEPTSGLDPVALIRLKDLIQEEKSKGKSFLVTTHIMSLVEELADELVFLLEGRIRFQGTYLEMMEAQGERNLERSIAKILEDEHA